MIQGLLLILKIVGIILLSIIIIILLIASLILFVPVRYTLFAKKREVFLAKIKITWLLHMVTATVFYQDELKVDVKVFGIPIYKLKKNYSEVLKETEEEIVQEVKHFVKEAEEDIITEVQEEIDREVQEDGTLDGNNITNIGDGSTEPSIDNTNKSNKSNKSEITDDNSGSITNAQAKVDNKISSESQKTITIESKHTEAGNKPIIRGTTFTEPVQPEKDINNTNPSKNDHFKVENHRPNKDISKDISKDTSASSSSKKPNIIQRIKIFFLKWIRFFKMKYLELNSTVKTIVKNISYYKQIWNSESCSEFRSLLKKQLLRIWKMIKPKKFKAFFRFGMEDPDDTGQILVWYSMLYPIFGQHIEIEPSFDEEIFEFEATASGKITIAILLRIALKIYFDKNFKKLLKLIKKENK